MKEREKCNKTSHHRPQCAEWFSRYSISKSGIWARWTSPFCRFSASFSLKYDVTDAMLQVHVPNFGGLSGLDDRGGGDNSIQIINFVKVGDKSFEKWRQKVEGWKGG